jgi:RimJ/RimL family protein N-acetyltransferase
MVSPYAACAACNWRPWPSTVRCAERAEFRLEGTLRGAAWVLGEVQDEVVYGLLAEEWTRPVQ